MESKLLFAMYSASVIGGNLLIEPVWNRNTLPTRILTRRGETFNRTSMESKLAHLAKLGGCVVAFNRTSMESKPYNRTRQRA